PAATWDGRRRPSCCLSCMAFTAPSSTTSAPRRRCSNASPKWQAPTPTTEPFWLAEHEVRPARPGLMFVILRSHPEPPSPAGSAFAAARELGTGNRALRTGLSQLETRNLLVLPDGLSLLHH